MSSDIFGLINNWNTGDPIGENDLNDLHNLIDNQLGSISDFVNPSGVLSGWIINLSGDFNVSAGEGWIADAHCKTTAPQAITGITTDDVYYIYAQRKTAAVGRVSESFSAAEVDFVANTTGETPDNAILLAIGTADFAADEEFDVINNTPNGRVTLRLIPAELANIVDERMGFMVVGSDDLLPATDAGLTSDISAGSAYIKGYRVEKGSVTSNTYTASKDTYVDLDYLGEFTFTEVENSAAAPAIAANSIRLACVVTDGDNITSVVDLRNNRVPDTGSADTEFVVKHGLGKIPMGFIVIQNNKAGVVYNSGTTWTTTNIYLKCSVANCNVSLLIF